MTLPDPNEIFAINPNYVMRRDVGVGTLCEGNKTINTIPHHDNFLSHIHLFTAILFSCFDGKRSFREAILLASELLDIPFDSCLKQALLYINNKEVISNKINNSWQAVPEFMLIPIANNIRYKSYSPDLFLSEKYDFNPPNRLSSPISLNLILTTNCVTNCKYCYAKRPIHNHPDFGLQSIINLIHQAKDAGVVKVDINGGDVLLYPHWDEVIKHLIEHDYTPLISTKKPIEDNELSRFIDLNIERIQISLDSIRPKVCSLLLNVCGDRYIENIRKSLSLLSSAGIDVQINSVITIENADVEDMDMLVDFLSQYPSVKQISFTPAGYSIYKKPYSLFAPTRGQINALTKHLNENIKNKYPGIIFSISEGEFRPQNSRSEEKFSNRSFCTANTRNAVILPDGRMTICEELYDNPIFIIGDLKKETLLEAWNSSKALNLFNYRQEHIPENSSCKKCSNYVKCRTEKGVCWKTIIMAYGEENWFFPDPLCPKAPQPINTYWIE